MPCYIIEMISNIVLIYYILGNVERVRVLAFDAIKHRRAAYMAVLVSIAGVWPQVLRINSTSEDYSK